MKPIRKGMYCVRSHQLDDILQKILLLRTTKQKCATACIEKWHLDHQPEFLLTRQGFDYYFGIPYSEDMTHNINPNWPPLPLMHKE